MPQFKKKGGGHPPINCRKAILYNIHVRREGKHPAPEINPAYFCTFFSIDLEQAKEVHRSLKLAAGMFLNIRDNLLPKLPASTEKGTDFDSRVVEAYAQQSQAEAQEITLARALELGHKPTVVSSLAAETATIFTQASE